MAQSTYEELFPEQIEKRKVYERRSRKIHQALKDAHLTRFTVSDLPALCKLLGLVSNSAGKIEPTEKELCSLEEKIFSNKED